MQKKKRNNKGFSLIELIAVIAILGILAVIAGGSLSGVASMRSRKAAGLTQAMMAQCRLDNLSGRSSTLTLRYDGSQKAYYAELSDSSGCYKSEKLGEDKHIGLTVSVGSNSVDVKSSSVTMTCSMETGAVTSLSAASGSWDFATVTVAGGRSYSLSLIRMTGSASMD